MPNGKPGPFVNISQLKWGDQIIIHAYGTQYIYNVRSVATLPYDDQSYLSHSDLSTLTLVTCKSYDESKGTYRWHVVVRAVLISKVDD
jgi:LPXTG-site transpeptidase (sortase) family protein